MNPKLPINKMWLAYKASVVPENASETQVHQTKSAFFAGANGLFEQNMAAGDMSREGAHRYFDALQDNFNEFIQELDAKDAKPNKLNGEIS
jgi:hypothetical protein